MPLNTDNQRVARERLTRVFRYLEALNQHRNPAKRQISEQPWVLWFRDLPDHSSIIRGTVNNNDGSDKEKGADDFVLRVQRPTITHAPQPPGPIIPWLERGWEDPFKDISVRESRNEIGEQGNTRIIRFEDDSGRQRMLEHWKLRRDLWARNEQPARRAMGVFEQLYELHGRINREAERVELVLGDGILSWRRPEGGVYHPVLLQRLQLEFDPTIPKFELVETEHEVELYSALFRSMADVEGKAIARCREELEQAGFHPLGEDDTSGFLKRLVVQLSAKGEFIRDGAPQGETDGPRIGREPVIFLRARSLGFASAIEAVLEDLQQRDDLPSSLVSVVGIESPAKDADEAQPTRAAWDNPEEILFSKPANPEQIRIAERLEAYDNVLVQGPPGTGKSHTIANLIGHLLAKGKSVLVTSHTTKALRVLRHHVVEKLRPLCVSVLESDIEGRKQLESSVEAIVARLSTSDHRHLAEEAKTLAAQRGDLIRKLQKARQDIMDARADEYRDIIVAGESYPPSEAARKVAREREKNDWIPAPVVLGSSLPLSEGELVDLYRTNTVVTPKDEVDLGYTLPNPSELWTPDEFERKTDERKRLLDFDLRFRSDLWGTQPTDTGLEDLERLSERVWKAANFIDPGEQWKLAALSAGWAGQGSREPWDNLISKIEEVCREAAAIQEALLQFAPVLSNTFPLDEQKSVAEEILNHLQSGGKLNSLTLLWRPSWRGFIRATRVANGPPRLPDHFRALLGLARLKILRSELAGRWDRQVAVHGAPGSEHLGDGLEQACAQFIPTIRACLDWRDNAWRPLEDEFKRLCLRWEAFFGEQPPNLAPHGELLRIREALTTTLLEVLLARANSIRWCQLETEFEGLSRKLALTSGDQGSSEIVNQLKDAIKGLDPKSYREGFQRLVDLYNLRATYERRRELLSRLEKVAPAWAAAIRDRQGQRGARDVPGDARDAWLWRQLHDELERRGKVSLSEQEQTIARLSDELQHATSEFIDRLAWAAQGKRTTLSQRQALVGWLDTVRKIGKGYGKRVSRLRAEATQKMSECRGAVPVWVMPLSRVVENFDPKSTRFDVVIIDEASQSDVMALLAFYLAKNVVIVGDHEQVSPTAVGQDLAVVQHLIDEYLQGIPNAILYDGQMSIYDLACQSFGGAIRLLEHFRCVPEIIQFSNHLSYNGDIKPLRDPSHVQLKPHVIAYRVKATAASGRVNHEEAWTVAALLAAAVEQPEYKSKTFGVISLVGEEQAGEIERILLHHLPPDEYQKRRILCGNAAHFQGDERDVMFLSVVDTPQDGPLALREAGPQDMFKKRFNVAASRARDQMWVVHSLDARSDLKPGDLRRRLIEHAEDPNALLRAMEKGEQRTQSEFEKLVLRRLVQAGYRVVPQWKVGYYRIDLVVEGGGKRLAIECEGDRFHPIEKLPEDMARQAILERLGWTFVSIRGGHFFRDPDAAMEPVFRRLEALGIPPEGQFDEHEKSDTQIHELKERIIRRAEELRRQWQGEEFPTGETGEGRSSRPEDSASDGPGEKATNSHQSDDDVEWVVTKGPSILRRLRRWALEKGKLQESEHKLLYWTAHDLDRKKTPSPSNARKVRRTFEKAVSDGFTDG
ncbi:MAG: hypothetical protein HY694_07670 [Deltaproteobacteria bacterium]|nr:hypothetical protein [Deltaproteobacteria bacterium]